MSGLESYHHQQLGTIKNQPTTIVRQSVQDVCIYLDTYPELTPPRITCRHYGPVSQACRRTGRGDLTSQDRHSSRNSGG